MVESSSTDSASSSKSRKTLGEQTSDVLGTIVQKIHQLEKQIQADRIVSVKEKLEKNRKKLEIQVSQLAAAVTSRDDVSSVENHGFCKMLFSRIESPLCKYSGFFQGLGDRDYVNSQEVVSSISAKLPFMEKIPPYTTWIFLDRNQRMAEDQSVVGRRRIYYDQHGSEALICSDSEEEIAEAEPQKHQFSKSEDRILKMVSQEHGLGEEVLDILTQFIGGTTSEIRERYNMLKEEDMGNYGGIGPDESIFLDKGLSAALDSFDNLFCRRCLVFDCRLHGCSQSLNHSSEKQSYSSDSEEDVTPCSDQCCLLLRSVKDLPEDLAEGALHRTKSKPLEVECRTEVSLKSAEPVTFTQGTRNRKVSEQTNALLQDSAPVLDYLQGSSSKKQKLLSGPAVVSECFTALSGSSSAKCRDVDVAASNKNESRILTNSAVSISPGQSSEKLSSPYGIFVDKIEDNRIEAMQGIIEEPVLKQASYLVEGQVKGVPRGCDWKPLEKELYLKGLEIFGRNSCRIARNLLSGLKTCIEVSSFMYDGGAATSHGSDVAASSFYDDNGADADQLELEIPARSRLLRRRGKARKLKYSWKSAGHPSILRRIADGKNQSCKQYTPCGCPSICGKQCPCLLNETCCEKYCGCSKSCKTRFRGCHCAKSQCRSRQCPCFAAGRECDPDVCRNCWVSCGDGSLGEPPRQGDGQCGNMRLLLRQQQRILLAKSDVAGWGAFLKNPVNKNDYLGEYTGELISHREADKRGKIYDRANSSFLFDLNDQYVLDAYRKGDKLKFANHSSNPNCYAKVMLVAGDHRVGIFANERIEGSEELFYDYRYGPDQAPIWARKPDGGRGDDWSGPQGRAKKHQTH